MNNINWNSAMFTTLVLQCSVLTLRRQTPTFLSSKTMSVICMSINSSDTTGEAHGHYIK